MTRKVLKEKCGMATYHFCHFFFPILTALQIIPSFTEISTPNREPSTHGKAELEDSLVYGQTFAKANLRLGIADRVGSEFHRIGSIYTNG